MAAIDAALLKAQIWNYIDGEKIKQILGHAGDASWSPFKLDTAGNPIGFQNAVVENAGMFMEMIQAGARAVEKFCYDAKGVALGSEKKKALVDWLNSVVDIPWVPESLEDNIIEFVVDKLIAWFNTVFGKNWIEKIPAPTIFKTA
ncbi:MAG: hypothetical protein WBP29_11255 [Candidatus Zixiibacteriota bacterium]